MRIADELNDRGIHSLVHWPPVVLISTTPWPRKLLLILATIRSLFSIKKGDVVFLQRTISNKYFFVIMVLYLKVFRRKMIFDFDDAIYMHDPFKTKTLTRMADAVIVCSQALDTWVRNYTDNVHVIQTTVKLADYEKFTKDYTTDADPVIIGWVGTARDHYKNLSLLAGALRRLVATTNVPFRFKLVGVWGYPKIKELFEPIEGLDVEFVEYLGPGEMAPTIQGFDIGVNPLVDRGIWNLSRCSVKTFEYLACGVAVISSNIGEMTYVIRDGENGFLADDEDEWVEKLQLLLESRELRARVGHAGQETMRTDESYEAIMPLMVDIITNVARS